MTIVSNCPIRRYRGLIRRIARHEDKNLEADNRHVTLLPRSKRARSPAHEQLYQAVIAESKRLGLPSPKGFPGNGKFHSRAKVPIAKTASQIRDDNRALLAAIVSRRIAKAAAKARKQAIDAQHAKGERHRIKERT